MGEQLRWKKTKMIKDAKTTKYYSAIPQQAATSQTPRVGVLGSANLNHRNQAHIHILARQQEIKIETTSHAHWWNFNYVTSPNHLHLEHSREQLSLASPSNIFNLDGPTDSFTDAWPKKEEAVLPNIQHNLERLHAQFWLNHLCRPTCLF